jgi:hypothetical protein
MIWACSTPGRHVLVPVSGEKIQFARPSDGRVYVAVTDSAGKYSISLPAGHYVVKGYFATALPGDVTVTAGQRVEDDFQYWWSG